MKHILIITALILMASCTNKNMVSVDSDIDTLSVNPDSTYHIQVVYTPKTDSSSSAVYLNDMTNYPIAKVTPARITKAEFSGSYLTISTVKWGKGQGSTTGQLTVVDTMYINDDRFCTLPDTIKLGY